MSRRTLRGAIPTTDSIVASTATKRDTVASSRTGRGAGGSGGTVTPGPPIFRPAPGSKEAGGRSTPATAVTSDTILLRGEDAARARRVDLVGGEDEAELGPVGPWAEQLDDARELARSSGFQQGRQEGLAAGLLAARHQTEANQEEARAHLEHLGELVESTLARVTAEVTAQATRRGEELAAQVTELALEIAKAIVDREISVAEDPGAEALARCLDLVPDTGTIEARLNPDDADALGQVPGLGDRELVVTPDPTLDPGDAIITVDQLTIDARLRESIRRVEEALR